MAEAALSSVAKPAAQGDSRLKVLRRFELGDQAFHILTKTCAVAVLLLLGGVIFSLIHGSIPALEKFGFGFLTSQAWNPVTENFGAAPAIYGTLITSIIALAIAVPLGLGIAVFLTELCPYALRRPIGIAVELLAGIPSIIYGIWGMFVLAPFLQEHVQPAIIAIFANVPLLNQLFSGPPYGIGIATAGLILSIMILPLISSISRDVFETVPTVLKESAFGIGCTRWEVIRNIVAPYTGVGLVGGIMLALGRALGETMAVTFVIGNAHKIAPSILGPGTTISATIANEFTEADGAIYTSSLITLGLLLFIITFIVLSISRLLLMRIESQGAR
ncbi:phosphate ABC transporter permease subunit PstC [Rhodoblastus sp. 17X3]|uniref:phosphate ABC transporter permease subunit PstC n=1 Tax=Rhodoblastus sp. 17X3 TaxID=3047026 RepID=UPI0024B86B5C|nr:phosphate ABC transporter permease subunit PstC [Rhodoblastus sp. 17X3]MDI9846890.1 phosphate ABC transporter permease subunit PstC [Rhodoblastus sp. 17X3]